MQSLVYFVLDPCTELFQQDSCIAKHKGAGEAGKAQVNTVEGTLQAWRGVHEGPISVFASPKQS